MSDQYNKHHYVPEWYQKRFLKNPDTNKNLYYLNLHPENFLDSKGRVHTARVLYHWGPGSCFAEKGLYHIKLGSQYSSVIESDFFGKVDSNGHKAIKYFSYFTHPSINKDAFHAILLYMTTQKLRTPKGLDWLAAQVNVSDKNKTLKLMVNLQNVYSAVWTECIWQIANASDSATKFIISDHPVTIYNRRCGPRSFWCKGFNDPDIRYNASHTIFPLDRDKVLILTNLSWARNPHQKETDFRPNPGLFRDAIFNFMNIQTMRKLSEQEVREINFIIKSRAYRYIAAEKEEWLYPERHVSKSDWYNYGKGYLFMPDPRSLNAGGEIIVGSKSGTVTGFDPYGRRPWQSDYNKEGSEFDILERFKGEFAYLFGPERRGRSYEMCALDPEKDSADTHEAHLRRYKKLQVSNR